MGVARRSGDPVPVLLLLECCIPFSSSERSNSSASDRISDSRSSKSRDSGFGVSSIVCVGGRGDETPSRWFPSIDILTKEVYD
jgi:hypothetical protein